MTKTAQDLLLQRIEGVVLPLVRGGLRVWNHRPACWLRDRYHQPSKQPHQRPIHTRLHLEL